MPFRMPAKYTAVLAWALLIAGGVRASATEDLLRLVPNDVGFCFVLQDLDRNAESFLESDFVRQVKASPLGFVLARAPEVKKLADFDEQLRKHLELDAAGLRKKILGDALVLAYRPPLDGKPEQGIILLQARDGDALAKLIQRLNELQKKSGELKELVSKKHRDQEYFLRREAKEDRYGFVRGNLLGFTTDEASVKRLIDQAVDGTKEESVAGKQLKKLGCDKSLAAIWVNPRAFDADLRSKLRESKGPDSVALKTFQKYWEALDSLAFDFTIGKQEIECRLAVLAQEDKMPPGGRKFFAGEAKPSELWGRFPENSIVVTAGHIETVPLLDMLAEFVPEDVRAEFRKAMDRGPGAVLGKDVLRDVLPNLGPDWGLCVAPPDGKDNKNWYPHTILALRVRPGDKEASLDKDLMEVVNAFTLVALLGHNHNREDPIRLKKTTIDKVDIRYLECDKLFPPGLRPAYAMKDGYLLVASSPEAISRFGPAKKESGQKFEEVPWLRLSFANLSDWVKAHQDLLAEHIAQRDKIDVKEAKGRLEGLQMMCKLFESLEVTKQSQPGQFRITVRLRTAKSVRK